jgi:hypothetical protein
MKHGDACVLAATIAVVMLAPGMGRLARATPPVVVAPVVSAAPAKITSISTPTDWWEKQAASATFQIGATPGIACAIDLELTDTLDGTVIETGRAEGTKFPYRFGVHLTRPGTYEVIARGAAKPAYGVVPCAGSASMKLSIGPNELGPLPTITSVAFDSDGSFFSTATDTDRDLHVGMANIGARSCAATIELQNKTTNKVYRPAITFNMDQQKVDLTGLIRHSQGAVTIGEYEVIVHSTQANANVGTPCLGGAKTAFHVVNGPVIRPIITYTTAGATNYLTGSMNLTVNLHAKIVGPKCAYTVFIGGKTDAEDKGDVFHFVHPGPGGGTEPAAEIGVARWGDHFRIHIHSRPEDAKNGPPCAGRYWEDDHALNYGPSPMH